MKKKSIYVGKIVLPIPDIVTTLVNGWASKNKVHTSLDPAFTFHDVDITHDAVDADDTYVPVTAHAPANNESASAPSEDFPLVIPTLESRGAEEPEPELTVEGPSSPGFTGNYLRDRLSLPMSLSRRTLVRTVMLSGMRGMYIGIPSLHPHTNTPNLHARTARYLHQDVRLYLRAAALSPLYRGRRLHGYAEPQSGTTLQ